MSTSHNDYVQYNLQIQRQYTAEYQLQRCNYKGEVHLSLLLVHNCGKKNTGLKRHLG